MIIPRARDGRAGYGSHPHAAAAGSSPRTCLVGLDLSARPLRWAPPAARTPAAVKVRLAPDLKRLDMLSRGDMTVRLQCSSGGA
jgi:hypothetical protein